MFFIKSVSYPYLCLCCASLFLFSLLSNIKPTKKQKKKATNNSTSKNESSDIKADKEKPAAKDYQEPCQTRTFPNGLTIEELTMGQPDGKRATKGNKVNLLLLLSKILVRLFYLQAISYNISNFD